MESTLLEKALKILPRNTPNKSYTLGEIELAVAFINGKIQISQYVRAKGLDKNSLIYVDVVNALKYGIKNQSLKLELA